MRQSFNLTRGLSNASHKIDTAEGCAYECASFKFRGEQVVARDGFQEEFQFDGFGYWYLHPTQNAIFEVFFSERFPLGYSRKYQDATVEKFLRSLRFAG